MFFFNSFNTTGFALKYTCRHFPTFKDNNGISKQEVPILMVVLVATAMSAAAYM